MFIPFFPPIDHSSALRSEWRPGQVWWFLRLCCHGTHEFREIQELRSTEDALWPTWALEFLARNERWQNHVGVSKYFSPASLKDTKGGDASGIQHGYPVDPGCLGVCSLGYEVKEVQKDKEKQARPWFGKLLDYCLFSRSWCLSKSIHINPLAAECCRMPRKL